jgi:hypothetical protein
VIWIRGITAAIFVEVVAHHDHDLVVVMAGGTEHEPGGGFGSLYWVAGSMLA